MLGTGGLYVNARYLTTKEKAAARIAAESVLDAQVEDITNRVQCMVFAAMLNAGLSARTVNRVIDQLPDVIYSYGRLRKEKLADYDMIQGLIARGVKVRMTKEEL